MAGSKRKYDRAELEQKMETIELSKRGTFRDLASGLDISHNRLLHNERMIRSVTSAIRPSLTNEQKLLRYHFCCERVDLESVRRAYTRGRGRWRFQPMFNRVFVDEMRSSSTLHQIQCRETTIWYLHVLRSNFQICVNSLGILVGILPHFPSRDNISFGA